MPTLEGKKHDESQQVASLLERGNLPIVAVATTAHGPDDEGRCHTGHTWSEDDRGE